MLEAINIRFPLDSLALLPLIAGLQFHYINLQTFLTFLEACGRANDSLHSLPPFLIFAKRDNQSRKETCKNGFSALADAER
jgi:hypothetical protein